jgi:hypothetical protein
MPCFLMPFARQMKPLSASSEDHKRGNKPRCGESFIALYLVNFPTVVGVSQRADVA